MFPARFAPFLFGFFLSGIMSCIVSGIATWREIGLNELFVRSWMGAWSVSWPVAFCIVLVVAPIVRRLVQLLVEN